VTPQNSRVKLLAGRSGATTSTVKWRCRPRVAVVGSGLANALIPDLSQLATPQRCGANIIQAVSDLTGKHANHQRRPVLTKNYKITIPRSRSGGLFRTRAAVTASRKPRLLKYLQRAATKRLPQRPSRTRQRILASASCISYMMKRSWCRDQAGSKPKPVALVCYR